MDQIKKFLEPVPLMASACLAAGLCWTVGSCLPLGLDAFYYIGASDFLRSALICVPVTLLLSPLVFVLGPLFYGEVAAARTRELVAEYERHGRRQVYTVAAIREALYHLPPVALLAISFLKAPVTLEVLALIGYYLLMVVAGTVTFANLNNGEMRRYALVSFYLGSLVLFSVLLQVNKLRDAEKSPVETICLGQTCRQGTVIARLSDATFIWWVGATALSIVRNDQITSVSKLGDQRLKPLWDYPNTLRLWL